MRKAWAARLAQGLVALESTRPPEILVHGHKWTLIRERETLEDLVRGEHIPVE